MEPLLPRDGKVGLTDLAVDLIARASHLSGQIQWTVRESIGDLVRSMNCYYSNLIEGHDTHPRDIDAAMADDYSTDPQRRILQREARAHIEVQRLIDYGDDPEESPYSATYIQWIHEEFCRRLPDELLWVENPDTGARVRVVPGEFRDGEVQVGSHVPPPATEVPLFLNRFQAVYDNEGLSAPQAIIAVAAAHHRFLWIHPFYDGNGRVARLMAHALLLRRGVGSSIWSVARGLARNSTEYKARLANADAPQAGGFRWKGRAVRYSTRGVLCVLPARV